MYASSVVDSNHLGVGKSPFLHLSKPCYLWPVRACVSLSFLHELNIVYQMISWLSHHEVPGFFLCIGSLGSCDIGQVGLLGFSADLLSQQTDAKSSNATVH